MHHKTLSLAMRAYKTTQPVSQTILWKRLFTSLRPPTQSSSGGNILRTRPSRILDARATSTRHAAARSSNASSAAQQRFFGSSRRTNFRFSAWRRAGHINSSGDAASSKGAAAQESLSLSARLKKLSKEYGWAAVGVYLGLSVLDFPFCFLLVRSVGTEKIGEIEHYVVSSVSTIIPESVRSTWREYRQKIDKSKTEDLGNVQASDQAEVVGWGVEQARERNKEEASLATQLALAYAIHKSFIFLRVPLTAAVTPKVVKVLRSWGWKIGRKTPR